MQMPGRNFSTDAYRFGFNGQERTDEISGSGNHYTATFWEYDPRLGRRWNLDPVVVAWESGYAAFRNNPIWLNDPNGDCPDCPEESVPEKHTIGEGETLSGIAEETGTTVDQLVEWNNIKDPDKIFAGNDIFTSDPNASSNSSSQSADEPSQNANDQNEWTPDFLLAGEGLIGLGSPLIDKNSSLARSLYPGSRVVGNASRNTSVASLTLRRALPSTRTVSWLPKATSIGGQFGRAVPILGYVATAYDIATFPWADAFEGYTLERAFQANDRINDKTRKILGDSWSIMPIGPK
jgi:hypothetical protein